MAEPEKPFACSLAECGMTFTNEDHLHVHTKKHDMVLQLGSEQKAAFVADQTPTPTRFIRNCEEVGLFQDLQNVTANPFDEGFKRAMETKAGILSLETMTPSSDDVLHTPQMVFPLDSSEATLFNGQRNITISRCSSDESGTIKEFETRTISKLTNEVTTISRIINTDDVTIKHTDIQKDVETVSYKNNVIRIESNIVRKDVDNTKIPVLVYNDTVKNAKDNNLVILDNSKLHPDKLPIMSQKSIDFVVDSLTSDLGTTLTQHVENVQKTKSDSNIFDADKMSGDEVTITRVVKNKVTPPKRNFVPRILPKVKLVTKEEKGQSDVKIEDYEVLIKLPGGKQVKMKPVAETDPKQIIRNRITRKADILKNYLSKTVPTASNNQSRVPKKVSKPTNQANTVNIPPGTLIPVTLVNHEGMPLTENDLNQFPITKITDVPDIAKLTNMSIPVPIVNKTTKNSKSKVLVIKSRKVPRESPKLDVKSGEPYRIANNNEASKETNERVLSEATETVCLTEEDVANKIKENNRKEGIRIDDERKRTEEDDDCIMLEETASDPASAKRQRTELERRCAASKRYRDRLKYAMRKQSEENRQLRESNQRLIAEKAVLKLLITEHMKTCPNASDMAHRLSVLTKGGAL